MAKYAGETKILGARAAFVSNKKFNYENLPVSHLFNNVSGVPFFGYDLEPLEKRENILRDEIKNDPTLQAVFGFVQNHEDAQRIIRVYSDKILFTDQEDEARYRERILTGREYEMFYNFLLSQDVDGLAPSLGYCSQNCEATEFLMFGKNGGRRIFFTNNQKIEQLEKLSAMFDRFAKGETKLKYRLAENIRGLEVLLADENLLAQAIWKKDGKIVLLTADQKKMDANTKELEELTKQARLAILAGQTATVKITREMRLQNLTKHLSWREFENGTLGKSEIAQPTDVLYLNNRPLAKVDFSGSSSVNYQRHFGNIEIGTGGGGIVKVAPNGSLTPFKTGAYVNPIIASGGKWIVAGKVEEYGEPMKFVRIDLQTAKEFPVKIPTADLVIPVSNVISHNKVLAMCAKDERRVRREESNKSPETPEYYLVDPANGAAQLVKGEFEPLKQQKFRSLQPTGNPSEFWAAIPDAENKTTAFGRYNDETFTFKPLLKIPEISFDSMDMLVDETTGKIYFIYEGHLLALPFPKE